MQGKEKKGGRSLCWPSMRVAQHRRCVLDCCAWRAYHFRGLAYCTSEQGGGAADMPRSCHCPVDMRVGRRKAHL